jgi:hypothetical protein
VGILTPVRRRSGVRPPASRVRDARALVVFGVSVLGLLAALLAALSHGAQRRSGTNGVVPLTVLASGGPGATFCQQDEHLPAGTGALRVYLGAQSPAALVSIALRHRGAVLDRTAAAGWKGVFVEAPIRTTSREVEGVDVCFRVTRGAVGVVGGPRPANTGSLTTNGREIDSAIPIEYLRAGRETWWSYAPLVVRRMGLGRGDWGGTWLVGLIAALTATSLALTAWLVLRRVVVREEAPEATWRRVPATAWTLMAIGALNAVSWSLITPMFQGPDEITHVAYAQQIAEAGRLPVNRERTTFAPELRVVVGDVRVGILGRGFQRTAVWTASQQRRLERDLHASLPRRGNDDVGGADPEPPLYYALEAIPYSLAGGATLLDRVVLMRLLSALMGGCTALLVFLFVRECLPGRPWAWTVGGAVAAFMPLFAFVSGVVNPDALLFPVCAALFLGLARAFRRGLTTRLAMALGVVLAVGALVKINFYGLVPGALIAIALAARRSAGGWDRRALRLVGIAALVGAVPYATMLALDALVWERPFILANTPAELPREAGGIWAQLSALWQVYLPRLPWQTQAFGGFPLYDYWLASFVGKFGPLSVAFPHWALRLAIVVLTVVGALALRALVRARDAVARRRAELLGYLLIAAGLLLLIGIVAVRGWAPGIAAAAQGRYLLPLLAPFALLFALAARGAGERWGRAAGVALVVIAVAWSLFGQLLTIAYYYG